MAGKGVEQDDTTAVKLFEQSCQGGHAEGCHRAGLMYLSAMGVEQVCWLGQVTCI